MAKGTTEMGWVAGVFIKFKNDADGREAGRGQPTNRDPTRVAGGTKLRKSDVPRQPQSFYIDRQCEVCVKGQGSKGRRLSYTDATIASLNRCQTRGEGGYAVGPCRDASHSPSQ